MCEWHLKSTIFTLMALTVRSTLWSAPVVPPDSSLLKRRCPCIPTYSTTKWSSILAMLQPWQKQYSFTENLFSYFENSISKPLYKIVALSWSIKEPSCKADLTDWIYLSECFKHAIVQLGNIQVLILLTSIRDIVPHILYYPHAPISLLSNSFTFPATEGWRWMKNVPAQPGVLQCHCNVGIKIKKHM